MAWLAVAAVAEGAQLRQACHNEVPWDRWANLRMLCYVLAVYAFSLSLGKFGLARAWTGTRRQQMAMYILAGIAVAFSVALVVFADQESRDALVVVALYSLFMGLQMLLTIYFLLQQPARNPIEPPSALNRASM